MLNSIVGLLGLGVAAGGGASYESIATVTVGAGGTSTITFSSIPSTYTHLQIRSLAKADVYDDTTNLRFNSDNASNYSWHQLYGTGSAAGSNSGTSSTEIRSYALGVTSGSINNFGVGVIDILDYTNTNKYKTTRTIGGYDNNSSYSWVTFSSGNWRSTSAITRIDLTCSGNFAQYSHFALYGIKGA